MFDTHSPNYMSDDTVLEQAAADIMKAAGDVPAPEKGGQDSYSVKLAEQEKKPTMDNDEAKKKRISDAEWQAMQEKAKKVDHLEKDLTEVKKALTKAPEEVQKEEDLPTQVERMSELLARKDFEADHPILKSAKYSDQWKKVCEENRDLLKTGRFTYEQLWKMIKDEPPSRISEELKEDRGSIPPASKGTVSSSSEVEAMANEMLRAAGIGDVGSRRII